MTTPAPNQIRFGSLTSGKGRVTWNVLALKMSGTMKVDKMAFLPSVTLVMTIFSMVPTIETSDFNAFDLR